MGAKLSGPGGGKSHTISQNADINVTPFVDIMLVLLIIFMVAAPMATVSIRLDLPPAVPPPPDQVQKEPVNVFIQRGGEIFIKGTPTTLEGLAADVCAALGGGDPACKEERVFVQANQDVTYNQFMEVMNELQAKGFYKVGLINEEFQ
ncbi:biopolymer transporter ExbD [Brevundimonas sp. Root1279]|uniref:biopolymer transporter ExbD n=1 Tax=Brevundimonas sp. Root1279 TaxID=1736443 RepID=UPI0006F5BDF4|nr:biopolymer transporter ExbD [Brevundimonas sp. Root1279]KQW78723.1 biopolymer transporter [Brevundimonas sp. Root1279]